MSQPLRFEFEDLSHERLLNYAKFLLRHYRLVDAYWFLKVEDNYGLEVATKFNEEIWAKLGEVSAKDIKKYLGVEGSDLKTIVEAVKYFPWTIIANWRVLELDEKRAVLIADKCPPQEARLRAGKQPFACKAMEQKLYENFVKVFNERVKVKCHTAPPDPKPEEYWCKWEFIVE